MRERPILFSAPMVRAILAGTKTQTRRVCKPAQNEALCEIVGPFNGDGMPDDSGPWFGDAEGDLKFRCPYGQPGDRLWVRETFAKVDGQTHPWIATDYRATYTHGDRLGDHFGIKRRWTPSIHMPREASRILLEIVGVRVERLQEISDADAIAEGIERNAEYPKLWKRGDLHGDQNIMKSTGFPKLAYRSIWEQINGHESWSANPWVWVVEFLRIEA